MEAAAAGTIVATSDTITEEGKWFIFFLGDNAVNFKNKATGNFLTARNIGDMRHDRNHSPGSWEKFILEVLTDLKHAVKTFHGKYLNYPIHPKGLVTGDGNTKAEFFQIDVCK